MIIENFVDHGSNHCPTQYRRTTQGVQGRVDVDIETGVVVMSFGNFGQAHEHQQHVFMDVNELGILIETLEEAQRTMEGEV